MSLITSVQVDIETGEIISPVVEKVQLGKGIMMGGKFFKVYDRTWNHIHEKFIGKFLKLSGEFMQANNTLMIEDKDIGELYKMRKKDITDFLGCDRATTTRFIKHLTNVRAIFKIDGYLMINPTFVSKKRITSTKHIPEMLKLDPGMFRYLPKKTKEKIDKMRKNGDLIHYEL